MNPTRIAASFFPLFTALFAAGFLLRPTAVWAWVFYLGVTPAFLCYLRANRFGVVTPAVWITLTLVLWHGLMLLGGDPPAGEFHRPLIATAVTLVLVCAGYVFFRDSDEHLRFRFAAAVAVALGANVIISLAAHLHSGVGFSQRLHGWAETDHPIRGAGVILVGFVFAVIAAREAETRHQRLLYATCAALAPVFLLLTGSRGPMLTFAAVCACLFRPKRFTLVALIGLAGVAAFAYLAVPSFHTFVEATLERKPYRVEIWAAAMEQMTGHWLFGYGTTPGRWFFDPQFTHPHSIYVSALYYTGAPGLALLLACLGAALKGAARIPAVRLRRDVLALLMVTIVSGITGMSRIVKTPSEEWYVLWLPIVFALGTAARCRISQGRGVPPGPPRPASAAAGQSARRPK